MGITLGRKVSKIVFLWRWNTGSPMDGVIRSDPGWFTWGEHVMHRTGKVYSWHRFPRIYRMGVRQGINLYTVGLAASFVFLGLWPTVALYGSLTALGVGLGLWLIIRRARRYWRNNRTVTPLASALAHKWGVAEAVAERGLDFAPDWQTKTKGRMVIITLPSHFAALDQEKAVIENLVANRLGRGCDFKWHTATGKGGGTVEVIVSPPLPKVVKFEDYLREITRNKPGEYIAGVRPGGAVERQTFGGYQPHHAACFGTGFGKSSFLGNMMAQILVQNEANHFTVCDTKMDSLEEYRGLRGVDIFADPDHIDDMIGACEKVYKVLRHRQAAQTADRTLVGTWPFEGLILEECNDFSIQLAAWWQANKGKGDPNTIPFWRDTIAPLLWQGRAYNVHVIAVFQNFMERFFGNLNLRPSFNPLFMAGYKPNQFKAMVGSTPPIKAQKGAGRILVTSGADEYWIQGLFTEPLNLRTWIERTRGETEPQDVREVVPS
jgi:hypothetical protein